MERPRINFDGLGSVYALRTLPDLLTDTEEARIESAIAEMNRRRLPVIPETRIWLAHELVSTNQIFANFGLTCRNLPSEFPLMNQILEPAVPRLIKRELQQIIEVSGTPASRKSHLILEGRREELPYHGVIEKIHDAKGIQPKRSPIMDNLRNLLTNTGSINKPQPLTDDSVVFELAKRDQNNDVDRIIKQMQQGRIRRMPIVHERWAVDQRIFARARFLMGQISYESFKFFADPFKTLQNITEYGLPFSNNYSLITCVSSIESMVRRVGEKVGNIMTPNSLVVFYEQYMRFHLQMIVYPRTVDYVCFDTSDDSNEVSSNFNNIVSDLISRQMHNKTYSKYSQPAK